MGANTIKNMVNVDLAELSESMPIDSDQDNLEATATSDQEDVAQEAKVEPKNKVRARSQKYVAARSRVDRTKTYPIEDAVNLVKKTSYSKFPGTITAHVNLLRDLTAVDVTFPHSTGKELRVAIADDELLEKIAKEEIEFDVLLASPDMMPKLAKHARFLGPRGLMPNPKSGTVTSNPKAKKSELESGKMTIRPEKKAPLLHVTIGKTNQSEVELAANLQALIKGVKPANIAKLTLAPTMGPGVPVEIIK